MRTASVYALVGEIFRKNSIPLIVTSVVAPLAWLTAKTYFNSLLEVPKFVGPFNIALLLALGLLLAAIFSYVDVSASAKRPGFPKHILLLPVPTWLLALVPIAAGSLFISAFTLLWLLGVAGMELSGIQQLKIVGSIIAMLCWLQAMNWQLIQSFFLKLVVTTTALVLTELSLMSLLSTDSDYMLGRMGGAIGLAGTLIGGYGFAYLAVIRARRGDSFTFDSLLKRIRIQVPGVTRTKSIPSVSTRLAAHDWAEWETFGRLLPQFMGVIGALLLGFMAFEQVRESPSIKQVNLMLLAHFGWAPLFGGAYSGKSLTMNRVQLRQLYQVLPLSDLELAFAKLKVAAKSHLLSVTIVVAVCALLILTSRNNAVANAIWSQLQTQLGTFDSYALALLAMLFAAVMTWNACMFFLSAALFFAGVDKRKHGWKIELGVVLIYIAVVKLVVAIYQSRHQLLQWFDTAYFAIMIPAALVAAIGLYLLRHFHRNHALGDLRGVAIGLVSALAVCLGLVWQLDLSIGLRWALSWTAVAVALMAFVPFLLVPILITMHRHR